MLKTGAGVDLLYGGFEMGDSVPRLNQVDSDLVGSGLSTGVCPSCL